MINGFLFQQKDIHTHTTLTCNKSTKAQQKLHSSDSPNTLYFIEPRVVIFPLHLTHPSYLGAACSHSAAPGSCSEVKVKVMVKVNSRRVSNLTRISSE